MGSQAVKFPNKWAFLVGAAQYKHVEQLKCAAHDALEMQKAFSGEIAALPVHTDIARYFRSREKTASPLSFDEWCDQRLRNVSSSHVVLVQIARARRRASLTKSSPAAFASLSPAGVSKAPASYQNLMVGTQGSSVVGFR